MRLAVEGWWREPERVEWTGKPGSGKAAHRPDPAAYGARAAELLEEVAMQVSARLQLEPAVARNLSGYLITAFHHRVRWECLRGRRLSCEGLLPELNGLEMFHGKHRGVGSSFATR